MEVTPNKIVYGDIVRVASEISADTSAAYLLTILIPTYKHDASRLINALAACAGADDTRLVIFDDGSADPNLTLALQSALSHYPGETRLVTSEQNVGRSEARNRLLAEASSDWVLLLDADMLPDDHLFLVRYLDAVARAKQPGVIAGGFSLKRVIPLPNQVLHALQSTRSECLTANERSADPGRFVFTSNLLIHRDVLGAVAFDDGYKGWGWEDVDWGLTVAQQFPVRHIDNTATHLGLDTDNALLAKYGGSAQNFARLVERHPDSARSMALYRHACRLRRLGVLRAPLAKACHVLAKSTFIPGAVRLTALKFYRALIYAGALS